MKKRVYKAENRGFANHGWLHANFSFSFANYYNPEVMQFGALRVLNDDLIAPKMGFGKHPHDNMEIITIPLKGILKHRDSMANEWKSVIPGEVQVMSAGSGLEHSEINGSTEEHLSLFQIWIMTNTPNVKPRYNQKRFEKADRKNKLQTLVNPMQSENNDSLKIYQNAYISRIDMDKDTSFNYKLNHKTNGVYIMTVSGNPIIEEESLTSRDAIGIQETDYVEISAQQNSDLLIIEVPMQ